MRENLCFFTGLAKTSYGGTYGSSSRCVEHVCAASHNLVAALALPDTSNYASHTVLTAENTVERTVLRYFDLLDHLTEGGTVPGSVLPCDAYLSCAFALGIEKRQREMHN